MDSFLLHKVADEQYESYWIPSFPLLKQWVKLKKQCSQMSNKDEKFNLYKLQEWGDKLKQPEDSFEDGCLCIKM